MRFVKSWNEQLHEDYPPVVYVPRFADVPKDKRAQFNICSVRDELDRSCAREQNHHGPCIIPETLVFHPKFPPERVDRRVRGNRTIDQEGKS